MPVLATIATINFFFGSGSTVSFLNPATLRARCESELARSDTRDSTLALVDELELLAGQYNESLAASLEAYVTETSKAKSTATDLIGILLPLDNTRRSTLHEIVRIRQSMLDVLSAREWDRVFR
jgi:hypothetical protein